MFSSVLVALMSDVALLRAQGDVDERVLEFLATVQASVAEVALKECVELDFNGVRNRSAYLSERLPSPDRALPWN